MKASTRRCNYCRRKIDASDAMYGNLKAFCNYVCLRNYASSNAGQKAVEKAYKAETAERKAKLKTRSEWLREAQNAFNAYVRLRDQNKPCISCGSVMTANKLGGLRDCGHMYSRGARPELRFRLDNTASQCVKCNRYLGGCVGDFMLGMRARWGDDRIDRLTQDQDHPKHTVEYLERVKDIFRRRANLYKKLFR